MAKTKVQIAAEIRARRKAAGQCAQCGGVPSEGKTLCPPCMVKQAEANKRAREKKIAQGICTDCRKRAAAAGLQKCSECTDRISKDVRGKRDELQASGICPYCKTAPLRVKANGKVGKRCEDCYTTHTANAKAIYRRMVAEKRCVACMREPAYPDRIYCKRCQINLLVLKYGKYGFKAEHVETYGKSCNICREPFDFPKFVFHVDHNHATDKFRGCLCADCNNAIARLKDSKELCFTAGRYLENNAETPKPAVDWTGFTDQFYRGKQWTKTEPELPN